jgi:hypothetical protein
MAAVIVVVPGIVCGMGTVRIVRVRCGVVFLLGLAGGMPGRGYVTRSRRVGWAVGSLIVLV